jgi:hypothetical protein
MDCYNKIRSNAKFVLHQDVRLGLVELACEGNTRAISVLLDKQADVNIRDQVLASLSAFLTFTLSSLSLFLIGFSFIFCSLVTFMCFISLA